MKLSEFVGYGDKMEQLMRSVQAGRIVHALLFTGPRGCGKHTMARMIAQSVVCSGLQKPCDSCPACKRFLAGTHPNVKIVEPEKKTIGVDEIRNLIDSLALKPYEGGKHIVMIDQAEKMTPNAQNALLKTLESPAGEALFILISDSPEALLNTVVSRCQTVRFHALSPEECCMALQKRGIERERSQYLAGLAQGSVGQALEMDADSDWLNLREQVLKSLDMLRDPASVSGAAVPLEQEKGIEKDILDIMELWARDLMAVQSGRPPYQSSDAERLLHSQTDGFALLSGILLARRQLAANVSWSNVLENMFFRLIRTRNSRREMQRWQW